MAKDNIIHFPNKKKQNKVQKARILQMRLEEIEVENRYIEDDIAYLKASLIKNKEEAQNILKEFALINGENFFSAGEEPVIGFENEWGDDFEFTPDFDIPDKPNKRETEWDELGDKLTDAAKKLEDAVVQLVLDLEINKDKPEDKE
tara:strand:+ start:1338 stop:1775 length:438 start_codon:yes stop_codon:yes gene_type:complete